MYLSDQEPIKCSKCGKPKPIGQFHNYLSGRINAQCKQCVRKIVEKALKRTNAATKGFR